jgi:hypothetical protein
MGAGMLKPVLMIAFHFPPLRGSSGIQRTLKFAQYLPQFGWLPLVLSAHPRAYANSGDDQLRDIPSNVEVHRPFALDTSRQLSFKNRYPGWLALPDRWVAWALGAVPAGWRIIRRKKPSVIWSTYPIATAHLIGYCLHRLTGLPWVVDMRDPMTDDFHPTEPRTRRAYQWIEARAVRHAARVILTTPGAIATYRDRYPDIPPTRYALVENAFDEENFAEAEQLLGSADQDARFVLLHSGVIYPSERDPLPLFEAVAALMAQGVITPDNFELRLRATGHDQLMRELIDRCGIGAVVTLAPHIAYRDALREMLSTGGLLILQAANCNHQVPAKLYEYLRARRPVLALTDPAGDTAAALRKVDIDTIAPLDDWQAITDELARFLRLAKSGQAPIASDADIAANSRKARAQLLAAVLDEVSASRAPTSLAVGLQSTTK